MGGMPFVVMSQVTVSKSKASLSLPSPSHQRPWMVGGPLGTCSVVSMGASLAGMVSAGCADELSRGPAPDEQATRSGRHAVSAACMSCTGIMIFKRRVVRQMREQTAAVVCWLDSICRFLRYSARSALLLFNSSAASARAW